MQNLCCPQIMTSPAQYTAQHNNTYISPWMFPSCVDSMMWLELVFEREQGRVWYAVKQTAHTAGGGSGCPASCVFLHCCPTQP
jgi:hypothetical protein